MDFNIPNMEWERENILINNEPHEKFNSKHTNWCYTIEPIVKAKRKEPLGYHFAGWSKKANSQNRFRIEGTAVTLGECVAICQGHSNYVMNNS